MNGASYTNTGASGKAYKTFWLWSQVPLISDFKVKYYSLYIWNPSLTLCEFVVSLNMHWAHYGCSANKRWPLIMNGTPTLFYIVLNGKAWDFITFMCGYDLYGSNWWWSAKILCIKLTRDNITVGFPDHHLFYWFGFNQTS